MAGYNMPAILLPTVNWSKYPDKVCECFEYIEASYGLKGYAITIKLWQKVCGSAEGYYCNWNDKVCTLFASKIHAGKGLVFEILNELLKEDFFNLEMYKKYGILTADWIQEKWLEYTARRKNAKIKNEYLLANCTQKTEIDNNSSKIASKNDKNVSKKDITELNTTKHNLTVLSDSEKTALQNLTQEQYNDLVSMSDSSSVDKYIDKIIKWQSDNHKKMKNPYLTIKGWIEQDRKSHSNKDTSYDLDEWGDFVKDFDPTKGGYK